MSRPAIRSCGYLTWERGWRRLWYALDVLQHALWLGLLDNRHLDEVGRGYFTHSDKYGDEKYGETDYNLSGLQRWEKRVVANHYPPGASILIAAAGGGREPIALARMGYQVDAFDSTPMLAQACQRIMGRERLPGKVFVAGPGSVPEDIANCYDGIVIGWGGYMHIPGRQNRVRFLSALRDRARAGAPLLLSFFCRPTRMRRYDWIYRAARLTRRLRGSADPVEYGDMLNGTFHHCFTEAEISSELIEGGFELIEYLETPYGHAFARAA
jgi:hypothetical protein